MNLGWPGKFHQIGVNVLLFHHKEIKRLKPAPVLLSIDIPKQHLLMALAKETGQHIWFYYTIMGLIHHGTQYKVPSGSSVNKMFQHWFSFKMKRYIYSVGFPYCFVFSPQKMKKASRLVSSDKTASEIKVWEPMRH